MGDGDGRARPVACVLEAPGREGLVVAGSVRSITLVIDDALRHEESEALVRLASGVDAWLAVRDAAGEVIPWRLREAWA